MNFLKTLLHKIKEKIQASGPMTRSSMIFFGGAALVLVVLIGGLIHQSLAYRSFEVVSSIVKNDNVSVNYQVMGDGVLRYSKDGVSYSENLTETIWNQSFEMASARAVTCGQYLAIGDIGSNQVRIFNNEGQVGSLTTTHPIVDLAVAEQGVVAVVLSENEANYINLYNNKGEELVTIRTTIDKMGYPLDIALSQNGEKLAVNYLRLSGSQMQTNMVFYHFGEAGSNAVDHIMGEFLYDAVYPKIEFLDNNHIAAYGETDFILYTMNYTPEISKQLAFGREIKSLFVSGKYLGFIFRNNYDEIEGEKSADGIYHMEVYTTAGRLYMQRDFDFEYEVVTNTNEEIIMYNDTECVMYTFNGKEKFRYTFDEPIIRMLPKNTKDEFILIRSGSIDEIRLK